jgi:hypothetical protein
LELGDKTKGDADQMMDEVYEDHIHQNPGTHLTGGITNDAL